MNGKHNMTRIKCILLSIFLISLVAFRYYEINKKYPSPKEEAVEMGREIEYNGCIYQLESWEWKDGNAIKDILPDYTLLLQENGEEYPIENEKVAFATVKITNAGEKAQEVDMTNIALESGAWHNQWDSVVYDALNGEGNLIFQIEVGECHEIVIPVILYEFQFSSSQWNSMMEREFHIVISNYPEKIYLNYKG